MKKQAAWVTIFCCFWLSGIVVGPVEAQEGQEDGLSNFTSRIAEVFGAPTREAAALREEGPESNVTSSHVFQATLDLIAEIETLREGMAVVDYPGEAESQKGRAPVHAYVKASEVLEKIARIQNSLGIEAGVPGFIPAKQIVPADVLGQVYRALEEARKIKSQLFIEKAIEPASFVNGKTPSLVYKNLGDASLLLDALVERPMTPSDVFGRLEYVYDDMELIATKLRVSLNRELPATGGEKSLKDVARLILRASHKIIDLENKLGMAASSVPQVAIERVTPAENFEGANILLAEMSRIKVYLNIDRLHEPRPVTRDKKPTDTFAQVARILRNLDILTEVATPSFSVGRSERPAPSVGRSGREVATPSFSVGRSERPAPSVGWSLVGVRDRPLPLVGVGDEAIFRSR